MNTRDRPPRWLKVLAWSWLVIATGTGMAGAVLSYRDPSKLRIEEFSAMYERIGLSDVFMLTVFLTLPLATALGAAFVILVRRPDDRGAVVLATGLPALFLFVSGFAGAIDRDWVGLTTTSVAIVLVVVLLATFPTGTFLPRWSIAAPAAVALLCLLDPAVPARSRDLLSQAEVLDPTERAVVAVALTTIIAAILIAQVIRYRRMSTANERHQSRWFLLGMLSMLLPPAVLLVLLSLGLSGPLLTGGLVAASAVGSYLFQAAVLIAIFRYHLYEIDRIVSRTVTYGVVAVLVSAVYGGIVLLLPIVLGSANSIVIAAATLAAAGAFNPIRARVQRLVDRRFNRARYDADIQIARFVARLPDQVDGSLITADLERTLSFTFEPRMLGVWIRH